MGRAWTKWHQGCSQGQQIPRPLPPHQRQAIFIGTVNEHDGMSMVKMRVTHFRTPPVLIQYDSIWFNMYILIIECTITCIFVYNVYMYIVYYIYEYHESVMICICYIMTPILCDCVKCSPQPHVTSLILEPGHCVTLTWDECAAQYHLVPHHTHIYIYIYMYTYIYTYIYIQYMYTYNISHPK